MRTCALVLKLSERELMHEDCGEYPVLLLDDVLSELDKRRQDFVLNRIHAGQVLITCCEEEAAAKLSAGARFSYQKRVYTGILRKCPPDLRKLRKKLSDSRKICAFFCSFSTDKRRKIWYNRIEEMCTKGGG